MERVLLDQVIMTDYGQFDVTWTVGAVGFDGDFDRFFAGQINGLVGAADPDGLYFNLARRSGGSPVRIVLTDRAPALDPDPSIDVVEVSTGVPSDGQVQWRSWASVSTGSLEGIAPGSYRVRVSARGRDGGRDGEFADGTVDSYLVEMWPAPPQPDAILHTASEDAQYWHQEVGGRR